MSEIKHGRGPNKRHKCVKIINGKYIYPEDLIKKGKKAALTVKDELNNAKVDSKKMIKRGRAIYDNNFTESGKKRVAKQIGTVDKIGREITNHVRRSTSTPYNTQQIYKKIPKNKKQLRRFAKKITNKSVDYGRYLKKDAKNEYHKYQTNKAKKLGAVGSIIKRADYERKIRQKNDGYAVPKSALEKRAENISRINQRNGKNSRRNKNKYSNNAAEKITNVASSARRKMVRPNNYGYDRTTEYGRRKMNTANRAVEKAFNSMKMPKVRKVKKSKLSEFKKKLKK
nr:MAG TPA: hypothetical protein [Caudoviricetes sp.]